MKKTFTTLVFICTFLIESFLAYSYFLAINEEIDSQKQNNNMVISRLNRFNGNNTEKFLFYFPFDFNLKKL
jgi:hypothetical protein